MANEVGNTQLSLTKQAIITEIAQRALISQSVFIPTFTDFSSRAVKGAATVSVPKYSSIFTVENRASATAGSNQNPAFAVDTIPLNVRAHIQWLVDTDDEIESTLDVQREYITLASQEHARDFDKRAIPLMEAAGIAITPTGAPDQDRVLLMRRILLRNKARATDLFLAVSPEDEAAILKIDPFVSADKYGGAARPLVTGVLGTIYGVQVLMTPELAGGQYFMYERGAMAFALQKAPAFDEAPRPEFGVGAKLNVLAQKYGQKAMQIAVPGAFVEDGETGLGAAQSAFIVKDGNAA